MRVPPASEWSVDIDVLVNYIVPRSRLHQLPRPIAHFLGHRNAPPPKLGNLIVALWALLGGFVGICVISGFFMSPFVRSLNGPIIIGSYGAAAVLEYGAIESPFSQPRNALFGQVVGAISGVCITKLFNLDANFEQLRWLAGALAVGIASALMTLTKTIHPPAGATALLAAVQPDISGMGWWYIPIVIICSLLAISVGCIINNIQRQFPIYWWTPHETPRQVPERAETMNDLEKQSTHGSSSNESAARKHWEGHEVRVNSDGIYVPETLYLSSEEMGVLEILQTRIRLRFAEDGQQERRSEHSERSGTSSGLSESDVGSEKNSSGIGSTKA